MKPLSHTLLLTKVRDSETRRCLMLGRISSSLKHFNTHVSHRATQKGHERLHQR